MLLERLRYLIQKTNEIQTQKMWHSTDEEVLEPMAENGFNPLVTTPHLVESVKKFLKWAIDLSKEFSVALHSRTEHDSNRSEEEICLEIG